LFLLSWPDVDAIATPVPDRTYCLTGHDVTLVLCALSTYTNRWAWRTMTDAEWDTVDATVSHLLNVLQDGNDGPCP